MASGDVAWFDQYKIDAGNKIHDMDSDTFKFALVTSVVTPTISDAGPHFGGTGTTNYATNEVTPGGNYSAGGPALTSLVWDGSKWDADNVSIAQNASNPTNARWAIVYNSTDASKRAVAFVDLGSDRDLTGGAFSVNWEASGISTVATA